MSNLFSRLVRPPNSRDTCRACAVSRTEELSWRIMAERRRHKKRIQVTPLHPSFTFAPRLFLSVLSKNRGAGSRAAAASPSARGWSGRRLTAASFSRSPKTEFLFLNVPRSVAVLSRGGPLVDPDPSPEPSALLFRTGRTRLQADSCVSSRPCLHNVDSVRSAPRRYRSAGLAPLRLSDHLHPAPDAALR